MYIMQGRALAGGLGSNPSLLQKLEDFYECRVHDIIKKMQS